MFWLSETLPAFGIRSAGQVASDVGFVLSRTGSGFQVGLSCLDALRPDLSLPAYGGMMPQDGRSPIYNLFDRAGGGRGFRQRVTRKWCRDFRGRRLTYDEHDGTDFVCPVGTTLCAAAPGTVVMIRDRWLRGGLTVAVDHGGGLLTQYTHCWKALASIGQAVRRGEPVALSGVAGIDMTLFFPWVPPHVHFMAWVNGRPVDPYRAEGESERPGLWLHGNDPRPAPVEPGEEIPAVSAVDTKAVDEIVAACRDDRIRQELAAADGRYSIQAAILEDALHHDDWAWPAGFRDRTVRPPAEPARTRLTLPLPADRYRGARFADSRLSKRPRPT